MRNIPIVTRWLLGLNVGLFLLTYIAKGVGFDLNDLLGLHFVLASDFSLLQLVTYMFMHGGFEHIFFNMFALWMFGCLIEQTWGARRFLAYYLLCGIGAGLFQEVAQMASFYLLCEEQIPGFTLPMLGEVARNSASVLNSWTTVGASGAVYGILLAFGMTYPEERMFIFPLPVPIKAKWFVVGYFAIEIGLALTQPGSNVAHLAHVGGMVVGFFLIRHWRRQSSQGYGKPSPSRERLHLQLAQAGHAGRDRRHTRQDTPQRLRIAYPRGETAALRPEPEKLAPA